jgi:hypothetical protein
VSIISIAYIHGFHVSGTAARGAHAEVFKRLYRLGFGGRFIAITWHGDVGISDYHTSMYNAFASSKYLEEVLNEATAEAQDGPLSIWAHSLGNMVVSNAIAQFGFEPANYFMMNAAVPIEAYDSTQKEDPYEKEEESHEKDWTKCLEGYPEDNQPEGMAACMQPEHWKAYPEKVKSSEWHELFPDRDSRSDITWEGRFSDVVPYAYNFFSPGDGVVEDPRTTETVAGDFGSNLWDALTDFKWAHTGRHT